LLGRRQFDYLDFLGTGLTPRAYLAFGENWIATIGAVSGMFHATDEVARDIEI
jgi:hypothetical protein